MAVYAEHDTLGTEARGKLVDQTRIRKSGGIDGDLVGALVKHVFRVANTANSARHAKWNVQDSGNAVDPVAIDSTTIRAGRNVVKNEFVSAIAAITLGKFQDIADNAVIAKLYPLDDLAIPDVQAGNYAARWNDAISSLVIWPSSNALPVIAAAVPIDRSVCRSRM